MPKLHHNEETNSMPKYDEHAQEEIDLLGDLMLAVFETIAREASDRGVSDVLQELRDLAAKSEAKQPL
jgi:hypothetical protein